MTVWGPGDTPGYDDAIGSGGWDIDAEGNLVPKGNTLNTPPPGLERDPSYNPDRATGWNARPTTYAEPPINPGDAFQFNKVHAGGPLATRTINTPNSSTGAPFRQYPGASSFPAVRTNAPGTLTPSSSSGASAPGVRTLPEPSMPGWLSGAASLLGRGSPYGIGGYLMGKTIEPQPTNQGEDEVLKRFIPPPNSTIGTQTQTDPRLAPPVPPGPPAPPVSMSGPHNPPPGPPPPGMVIPPFTISPQPQPSATVPYPPPRPKDAAPRKGGKRAAGPGPGAADDESAAAAAARLDDDRSAQRRRYRRAKRGRPARAPIFQSGARAWGAGANGRIRLLDPLQPSPGCCSRGCAADGSSACRSSSRPSSSARPARPRRAGPAAGPGPNRSDHPGRRPGRDAATAGAD